eukprot:6307549-Prorocentrum_lima.AAC.1
MESTAISCSVPAKASSMSMPCQTACSAPLPGLAQSYRFCSGTNHCAATSMRRPSQTRCSVGNKAIGRPP